LRAAAGGAGCGVTKSSAQEDEPDLPVVTPSCAGLDACACLQTPGCAPLATDCWCPTATCGGTQACACQGGLYLGCGPTGGGCRVSACPLLAAATPGDAPGACSTCTAPADCASAVQRLGQVCPALVPETTQWICAGSDDVCATFCLGQVRNCDEAACFFCEDCSCGSDTLASCLYECEASRQARH
jgi:hypothetical protein